MQIYIVHSRFIHVWKMMVKVTVLLWLTQMHLVIKKNIKFNHNFLLTIILKIMN
jgi:hypothetical protein